MIEKNYRELGAKAHIDHRANVHGSAIIGSPPQWKKWWDGDSERWYPAVIREGVRIGPLCVVDGGLEQPTFVGADVYLMSQVHIAHDCHVGQGSEIAAGTVLGGGVFIGKYCRLGVGVLVKPYVRIGEGARIGAGAVVIRDVPDGQVWAGVPARKLGEHEDNPLLPKQEPEEEWHEIPSIYYPPSQAPTVAASEAWPI